MTFSIRTHNSYYAELEDEPVLPNILREIFSQRGLVKVAMVLDAARSMRLAADKWYTFSQLQDALQMFPFSEKLLREALNCNAVFKVGVNLTGQRGRPEKVYQLPGLQRLFADWVKHGWYRVAADKLPLAAFESTADYLAHLHTSMILRMCSETKKAIEYPRQRMAARLGVSVQTIRNYEKRLGQIHVTQRFTVAELVTGVAWNLPTERKLDENNKPEWSATMLEAVDEQGTRRRFPAVRAVAAKLIQDGWKVWKVTQLSNTYEPAAAAVGKSGKQYIYLDSTSGRSNLDYSSSYMEGLNA